MTYGTIKVDTVIFTDAGVDKSVTLSGLVQNPTFSGNVTVTGTLSGVTVTGTTANFTSGNFTNISGGTHTITSGVFAAGSAASPSITFTGDLNTGIYSPGADQVAISTSSSERIRIGANGEIGLGGANYGTNGQVLTSAGSGAAPTWQTLSVSANSITQGNTNATVIDTGSDGRFVVTTEGTERLRVDSSGRLGLGTSTVDSRFVVRAQSGVSDTPIVKIEHPSNDADFAISGLYDSDGNVTYLGSNLYYDSSYAPARFDTGKPSSAITLSGRTGNGEITFLTGTATASERARIDSSGRLLVGTTTSNGAQLEVNRPQSVATGLSALLSSPQFSITNSSNWGFPVGAVFKTPLANGGAIVDNAAIWAEWSDTNSAYLGFATRNSGTIAERVRIDSSGRLLVGTSSARDKFNNSASGQDPLVQFEAAGTAAKELYMLSLTANNNSTSSNAGVSLMLARSNGTTLNSYDLVPSGNCIGQIRFQAADGSELVEAANISAFVDGTSGANDMPGRLVFSTTADGASSPTERMRIANNGTIFLRATSLTDGANIQGANAYVGWRFDSGSNSDTLADQNTALCSSVYTSTNTGRATSALLLMSRAGASVGICPLIKGYGGAGSEPSTATLQFLVSHNGNVQNTNNSYGSLSDLRLKENIVDAESQWQDIKSLQVRKFNFKNDAAKTPLLGLVAQEVEPISPGLIEQVLQADGTPDPEIPKAIKYSVLYMKAVKALQEAMERIETLEAKVAALESA